MFIYNIFVSVSASMICILNNSSCSFGRVIVFFCCCAPTRGTFLFLKLVCFFRRTAKRKGYPLLRTSHVIIINYLHLKHKHFIHTIMLVLVNIMKVCLNNSVQKHTRITAKGERLPLVGKLSSSQESQKRSI